MVENEDGTLTKDWDGNFIYVEVQNDTGGSGKAG